jgi:hypothetical protein
MGKGTVAKKRKASKTDSPDRAILKEELGNTGPYILRDFCRQHDIDPDEVKTLSKLKLIAFLMGRFDDGELSFNGLFPDKKGKKPPKNEEPDGDDLDDLDDLNLEFDEDDEVIEGDEEVIEGDEEVIEGDESEDTPDISVLEDKIDKLVDLNSKVGESLDLAVQLLLELMETVRQGLKVQFKLGKIKNPGKLLKQIEQKARESVSVSKDSDDDELEDE